MLPPNVLPQIAGRAAGLLINAGTHDRGGPRAQSECAAADQRLGLLAMRAWPVAVDAAAILARKAEVEAAMAKGRGRRMSVIFYWIKTLLGRLFPDP